MDLQKGENFKGWYNAVHRNIGEFDGLSSLAVRTVLEYSV